MGIIYERIKKLCKLKNKTVTGLEAELGISRGSLCKIDINKPSADKVQRLADSLGVSVAYIMEGEENNGIKYYLNDETARIAQEIYENKDMRILFDASRKTTPEGMKALIELAKALRKNGDDKDDFGC